MKNHSRMQIPFVKWASKSPTLDRLRAELAAAAQAVYDEWDESDIDLNGGGICDQIAEAQARVLDSHGIDSTTMLATVGDHHVFVVARVPEGVFEVNIPAGVYETGAAYRWHKIPGVIFDANDIHIELIDPNPDAFADYEEQMCKDAVCMQSIVKQAGDTADSLFEDFMMAVDETGLDLHTVKYAFEDLQNALGWLAQAKDNENVCVVTVGSYPNGLPPPKILRRSIKSTIHDRTPQEIRAIVNQQLPDFVPDDIVFEWKNRSSSDGLWVGEDEDRMTFVRIEQLVPKIRAGSHTVEETIDSRVKSVSSHILEAEAEEGKPGKFTLVLKAYYNLVEFVRQCIKESRWADLWKVSRMLDKLSKEAVLSPMTPEEHGRFEEFDRHRVKVEAAQEVPLVKRATYGLPTDEERAEFLNLVERAKAALPLEVPPEKLRVRLYPFLKPHEIDLGRKFRKGDDVASSMEWYDPSPPAHTVDDVVALDWIRGEPKEVAAVGPVGFTAPRRLVWVDVDKADKRQWWALDIAPGWVRSPTHPDRFELRLPVEKAAVKRTQEGIERERARKRLQSIERRKAREEIGHSRKTLADLIVAWVEKNPGSTSAQILDGVRDANPFRMEAYTHAGVMAALERLVDRGTVARTNAGQPYRYEAIGADKVASGTPTFKFAGRIWDVEWIPADPEDQLSPDAMGTLDETGAWYLVGHPNRESHPIMDPHPYSSADTFASNMQGALDMEVLRGTLFNVCEEGDQIHVHSPAGPNLRFVLQNIRPSTEANPYLKWVSLDQHSQEAALEIPTKWLDRFHHLSSIDVVSTAQPKRDDGSIITSDTWFVALGRKLAVFKQAPSQYIQDELEDAGWGWEVWS